MSRCRTALPPLALALGALFLAACGDGGSGSAVPGQMAEEAEGARLTLTGAGATFAMPLITLWSHEYNQVAGARVNYNSIGSGGGIRAHIDGTVDFAATEAPLTVDQFERAEGTLTIPFTIGTVTVAYNLPGVEDLRLTGEVLADIYLGEIGRWSDRRIRELNPAADLPDAGIVVTHRSDGSGTTYVFTDYLGKVSEAWARDVGFATSVAWPLGLGGNGNEGVAGAIRNNPNSIGYIELAYAENLGLSTAAIRNREGNFLQPSLEGGTAAAAAAIDGLPAGHESWHDVSFTDAAGDDSYPISSFSYFLVHEDLSRLGSRMTEQRAGEVAQWIDWAVTEGQAYNGEVQNAALPEAVRGLNLESLERLNLNGEPVRSQ